MLLELLTTVLLGSTPKLGVQVEYAIPEGLTANISYKTEYLSLHAGFVYDLQGFGFSTGITLYPVNYKYIQPVIDFTEGYIVAGKVNELSRLIGDNLKYRIKLFENIDYTYLRLLTGADIRLMDNLFITVRGGIFVMLSKPKSFAEDLDYYLDGSVTRSKPATFMIYGISASLGVIIYLD